jgi:hypothetical protein
VELLGQGITTDEAETMVGREPRSGLYFLSSN